ncbi:MAG: hypothetical protein EA397_13620 [Deltaproteobacteria bacterium]|nr:MAG: hypothetical protein EA397_13620 [Deltaproteobacteria bacterium]
MPDPVLHLRTLFLWQIAGAAALAVPTLLLGGFCAAWVPPIGTLAAAFFVFFTHFHRHPDSLCRLAIRRLAMGSGALHAFLVALAYAVLYLASPQSFAFELGPALVIAPVLGIASGGVAAVLTLCAGDGAASTVGGWPT